MLPPHGVWIIEANPVIIHASQTTANLYFCLFLCAFVLNSFNCIILFYKSSFSFIS